MANPWTGAHFYDQGTLLKEDVLDILYMITPEETPAFNMVGDGSCMQPIHQWHTRAITTRQDNAAIEGKVYSSFPAAITATRKYNFTQIFDKLIRITRTSQSSNRYGVRDQKADQTDLRFREFKTDIEHAIFQGSLATGNASQNAARFDGFIWAHSASSASSLASVNDASTATMTEDVFNEFLERLWTTGARPKDIFVNGKMKRRVSTFTASSTKFVDMADTSRRQVVSMYESDFQIVNIHLSRDVPQALGTAGLCHYVIAVDLDMWKKAWLDRPFTEPLGKTADSYDGVIVGELTLEYGHESAGGWLVAK